jgi:hypothetical protein
VHDHGRRGKVIRKAVEAAGLDWREWGYFVVEMHEHQRDTLEHMTSEVARIESATGEKIELPKLEKNRLGLGRRRRRAASTHHARDTHAGRAAGGFPLSPRRCSGDRRGADSPG